MDSDDTLRAALRQLRADYLDAAPQRLAELWTAYARVQNGGSGSLDGLRLLVHRLAGTGGSYGLPAVTEHAGRADRLCRAIADTGAPPTPDDLQQLRQLIQGIADAFQDATTPE